MPSRRAQHFCSLVNNREIVVAGGFFMEYLDTVDIFDLGTMTWRTTGKNPIETF